jgi:hypothetical protein
MANPTRPVVTVEQIAKNYSACLDSVNLINKIVAQSTKTAEDVDTVDRNTKHLKIMLAKTYWTTEDMSVIRTAAQLTVTATA